MSRITELIEALKDGDASVRKRAAEKLGLIKDPRAVEPLIAALEDEYRDVRYAAVEALGKIKNPRAVEPLINALGDWREDVRLAIKETLDTINPNWRDSKEAKLQVSEFIAALLDEYEDDDIHSAAARALGLIQDPRAVEPLINALKDKNKHVRYAAAVALGDIQDSRAVEPLIDALKDKDGYVRSAAEHALNEITPDWRDLKEAKLQHQS